MRLHERVLAGGHERIVVVAVRRLVDGADLPPVALDVVRAHVRSFGGAEGLYVHGREVRGVEEVVGELQRAHRGVARCGLGTRERRVLPFGERMEITDRFGGRQPDEAEALAHREGRVEARSRREDRVGAERRDGGGASVVAESPPVVAALELAADDASAAQRGEAVRAAVAVRAQTSPSSRARAHGSPSSHTWVGRSPSSSTRATACQPRASAGETLSRAAWSMVTSSSRGPTTAGSAWRCSQNRNGLRVDKMLNAADPVTVTPDLDQAFDAALRHCWHPVCSVGELAAAAPHPLAVRLLDTPLAVVDLGEVGAPDVVAVVDRCPHRSTRLSIGWTERGVLRCANHGWCFDAVGRCTDIPSLGSRARPIPERAHLHHFDVEVAHGLVWVRLESGAPTAVPAHPSWSAPGFKVLTGTPYTWPTSAARRVENFVDIAHFPWVHDGSLGRRDEPVPPLPEVRREAGELRFEFVPPSIDAAERGVVRMVGVPDADPVDRRHRVPTCERRHALALDDGVAGGRAHVPHVLDRGRATTISTVTTRRTWGSRN